MHFQPKDETKREFHERVIRYVCAEFRKLPENTSRLSMDVDIWSNFMGDYTWASYSLSAEYEQYKRLAMNQDLSHTQVLLEAV